MEDQWIHKLHKKLADHKEPAPEGLWDDIEMALKKKKHPCGTVPDKILFWARCIGAAAAVMALAFLVGRSVFTPSEPSGLHKQAVSQAKKVASSSSRSSDWTAQKNLIAETIHPSKNRDRKKSIQDIAELLTSLSVDTSSIISAPELSGKNGNSENKRPGETLDTKKEWNTPKTDYERSDRDYRLAANHSAKEKKSGRLTIGLFTSNLPETSQRHEGYGGLLLSAVPPSVAPDDAVWGKEPMTDILLFNQNKETYTQIKHKQPVRAGVSFRYPLNNRFSLESGLAYTRLLSHLTSGSDSYHYETEQSLQYIGISLNLEYNLWKNKLLDFYLSGGGMVEKCVSGKSVTDYILDNKVASTETKNIKIGPLQCSANAAAGIQLNLLSRIGIYAEPGISYYFDNNSPVETIYKEKPLNFNLEIGIRFSFK